MFCWILVGTKLFDLHFKFDHNLSFWHPQFQSWTKTSHRTSLSRRTFRWTSSGRIRTHFRLASCGTLSTWTTPSWYVLLMKKSLGCSSVDWSWASFYISFYTCCTKAGLLSSRLPAGNIINWLEPDLTTSVAVRWAIFLASSRAAVPSGRLLEQVCFQPEQQRMNDCGAIFPRH